MRQVLPTAACMAALTLAGCATTATQPAVTAEAPARARVLTAREREALLLLEMDRSRKRHSDDLDRLVKEARKGGDPFIAQREKESRSRSVVLYRSLVDGYPDLKEEFMAEANFRLAELLFETERERLRTLIESQGEGIDARPDFTEAISYYRRVVERYPTHPLAEDALYGLSYCYTEQGEPDLAAAGYSELIERFPSTRHAVEIHMRLGEHFFSNEDLAKAIEHYRFVADSKEPDYADKALYKLGWCYYNLDRYEEAIETFFALLYFSDRQGPGGSLVGEAIQILARSYAESGGTPALARRFTRHGFDTHSPEILLTLADLYKDRSLYPEAIGTYRTFAQTFPDARRLPEALERLRECYFVRGDTVAALQSMESMHELLGPGSSWYANAGEGDRGKVMTAVLDALENAAVRRRARSQAGGKTEELSLALADLETYEKVGARLPCRIAQLRGVIQSELSAYPDAALTFNTLTLREECADLAPGAALASAAFQIRISEERPDALDMNLFERTVAILEAKAPADPSTPRATIALGEILLNAGQTERARGHLSSLIRRHAESAEAGLSRMLIARSFFKDGDFKQAAAWFSESWKKAQDPEAAQEARKLHIFSLFKQAEALVEDNRRSEAAERFETIYRQFPDAEVSQISLYNAGKLYRAMGLEIRATALFEELAKTYRESDLASEALSLSVLILESLGDPVRAGQDSLALAERSTGEDRAKALAKAADLFTSGQAFAMATSTRRAYLAQFPEPFGEKVRQTYLLAEDLMEAGDWPSAALAHREVMKLAATRTDDAALTTLAARSALRIAEESFQRYNAVTIGPPLEETVERKRGLLQEVVRNFVAAGNYRTADVITAANFYMGRALELFKEGILESPRPAELNPEQLGEYELMLEEMAYPFEERALKAYRVNIQRAVQIQILDPWIVKSYQRMAELAPWAYEREEILAYPVTSLPPTLAMPVTGPVPDRASIEARLPAGASPAEGTP